jgi:hypothetical protein
MTIELFLQAVFQISIAIAFTGLCAAGVSVSIYYSWKMAEGLIKKRESYAAKLKKSMFFKTKPVISMVKSERNGKVKVKA